MPQSLMLCRQASKYHHRKKRLDWMEEQYDIGLDNKAREIEKIDNNEYSYLSLL